MDMSKTPELLTAIAALLWPAAAITIVLMFRPAIRVLIESAKSRKFTLRIAGQELSMEEISDQQRGLIADLQAQVVEIQKGLAGTLTARGEGEPQVDTSKRIPEALSILWVDDQPKNNSYFAQQLDDLGVSVELSLSTSDALRRLERGSYTALISDMGREEAGRYNPTAGLDLLRTVRGRYPQIPVVIFCSNRGVREHGKEALALGAAAITASPTELFGVLRLEERTAKGA